MISKSKKESYQLSCKPGLSSYTYRVEFVVNNGKLGDIRLTKGRETIPFYSLGELIDVIAMLQKARDKMRELEKETHAW